MIEGIEPKAVVKNVGRPVAPTTSALPARSGTEAVSPAPVIQAPPRPMTPPPIPTSVLNIPPYIPGNGKGPVGRDFDREKMRVKGPTQEEVMRNVTAFGSYYKPGQGTGQTSDEKLLATLEAEVKTVQEATSLTPREKGQRLRRLKQRIASVRAGG